MIRLYKLKGILWKNIPDPSPALAQPANIFARDETIQGGPPHPVINGVIVTPVSRIKQPHVKPMYFKATSSSYFTPSITVFLGPRSVGQNFGSLPNLGSISRSRTFGKVSQDWYRTFLASVKTSHGICIYIYPIGPMGLVY